MRKTLIIGLSALVALLGACGETSTSEPTKPVVEAKAEVVNLYSSRHYDTDLALYDNFTKETGITINRIEAGADELIERILSEGETSPADVLITVDAGRLWRAKEAGIFQSVESQQINERIPAHLRHPEGLWFGVAKRARVIIYNREAGLPEPLRNYADLADPAHRDSICIRSSSNIYNISLLASIVARSGAVAAEDWARGVVANFARKPQSNDTGQIRAVASGECRIGVVNSYYLARLAGSEDTEERAVAEAVSIVFPNQDSNGTHINISGVGVVRTSPNRDNAVRFLEYLTGDQAQRYLADGNNEYPVVPGLKANSSVEALGTFSEDEINAALLGQHQAEAIMVFDRVGWN